MKRFRLLLACCLLLSATFASAAEKLPELVISLPGPHNISYLPLELISAIGADRAEGATVKLRYFGGGGAALQDLNIKNSDFTAAGLPAVMSLKANGGQVNAVAAVNDAPLFVLMVRSDLKGKIKKISDLKGRTVGVNSSSITSKTTSQQLAELALKTNGVPVTSVRFVNAGQSWDAQSSMIRKRGVDAIMGDEPFASRLLHEKQVYFLLNLADPKQSATIPGGGLLHVVLSTRSELIQKDPQRVELMVKILRRTLQWLASATPEQVADKLGISDPVERRWLIASLKKYPSIYTSDGRFPKRRLAETELFFRESSPAAATRVSLNELIVDRWSGRRD